MAPVAGEVGVTADARPEIDHVGRGRRAAGEFLEWLERLAAVDVEGDRKDLQAAIREPDDHVLAVAPPHEERHVPAHLAPVRARAQNRAVG